MVSSFMKDQGAWRVMAQLKQLLVVELWVYVKACDEMEV